jgi:hypothetical protein
MMLTAAVFPLTQEKRGRLCKKGVTRAERLLSEEYVNGQSRGLQLQQQ